MSSILFRSITHRAPLPFRLTPHQPRHTYRHKMLAQNTVEKGAKKARRHEHIAPPGLFYSATKVTETNYIRNASPAEPTAPYGNQPPAYRHDRTPQDHPPGGTADSSRRTPPQSSQSQPEWTPKSSRSPQPPRRCSQVVPAHPDPALPRSPAPKPGSPQYSEPAPFGFG